MTAHLTGPVQASERIQTLDIVRGFALLGILIMNMPGFASSFFAEADGSHLWADALNQRAEQIRDMLFSGKFNSMFSLLFGIGFTLHSPLMDAIRSTGSPSTCGGCSSSSPLPWCTASSSGPATCCTSMSSSASASC